MKAIEQMVTDEEKTGKEQHLLKKLGFALLTLTGAATLRLICMTIRKSIEGREWEEKARALGRGVIYAFWHGRMFYYVYHYRGSRANVLISHSQDGEFITRVIRLFGFKIVRGSRSGGGLRAFHELASKLEKGEWAAITPDGPRGPGFKVHQGVIALAARSASPILPMTNGFKKKKVFRSWDSFVLPYPFTRARIIYGQPILVPPDADPGILEAKRLELEESLKEITERADASFQ